MKKATKNLTLRKTLTALAVCAGTLVLAASAYAGYLYNKVNATIKEIAGPTQSVIQDVYEPDPSIPMHSTEEEASESKRFTLLLTAIDERKGSEGSLNTDVMMLLRIDPVTRQAAVVSIPRDTEIRPEESGLDVSHKANYFYAYYYNKDKSTAFYHTKQLYSGMFQVPVDYMAIINFDGFRKLIDEVGGLQIEVDMDMKYKDESDGTYINLKKGIQKLDGKQTLDYLRYRKSNLGTAESSDLDRNKREQLVLNQLMEKLASFQGVAAWSDILDIVGKNVKTDIPEPKLLELIRSYRELQPETLQYIPLTGDWVSPYVMIKQEDLENARKALRFQTDAFN